MQTEKKSFFQVDISFVLDSSSLSRAEDDLHIRINATW